MKNQKVKKWVLAVGLTVTLAMPNEYLVYAVKDQEHTAAESTAELTGNVINVGSAEEFLKVVEQCKYDNWSIQKTINLTADIDLSKETFEGIGYFNGTFEGNGHTISIGNFTPKGSNYGFFRYIGKLGVVNNLNISASVSVSGSAMYIGGVVGTNYGTVKNTVFHGTVSGQSIVGGIAGINKSGANILNCSVEGGVIATDYTGGITGKNEGLISNCTSKSSVNVEELETSIDLGGVDLGSLNFTQRIVSRNNMGGIAGSSNGIISDCKNLGTIGFNHTGYNVGGIVGSQKGTVLNCTNEGTLYGRKDVGGIVGQAMPYIESEYLEDQVVETKDDIERLNHTLRGISASISQASTEATNYVDSLHQEYTASMRAISESLDNFLDAILQGQENPQAQEYVENIKRALGDIRDIQSGQEGKLSQEQIDAIQEKLGVISDNLGNLQGTYTGIESSVEDLANTISQELNKESQQKNWQEVVQNVDSNIQAAANGISSAANQLSNIANNISDDFAAMSQEDKYMQDISSIETAKNIDGVISGSINRGSIYGDLNVGGIAGTMNIEYENDPEFDLDLTESVSVTLRSTVNNVIIHSINYGDINLKRNCAGGIVGLQELGLIYDCEGYGPITSETGNYLGGIVGRSASGIQKTYSLCNVSGENYLGGICGSGYTVKNSISVCDIESEGEYLGSISGELREKGEVKDNLYVSTALKGVDDISYAGMAEQRTYEQIMALEGIPKGFQQVSVNFETEDGEKLGEKTVAYGGTLTEKDFPQAKEKEGCYIVWSETEKLKDIRQNLTVYAEQIPWTESIAGDAVQKNGKEIFLVKGEFHKDTTLTMEETEKPSKLPEKAKVEYAYTWNIHGKNEKPFETLEGHFYIPDSEKKATLWVKQDEKWKKVESSIDGSYLVANIPYGAAFALVSEPIAKTAYLLAAGMGIVILVGVLFAKKTKKPKRK